MKPETILTNPNESNLANAVQENLFALFRAMAGISPDSELIETDKLSYHLAFPSSPMFKGIWRSQLSEDEANKVIEETIAWFKAHEAPYLFWWTGPGTTPADLGARLRAHGLLDMAEQQQQLAGGMRQTAQGAPGMAADLHQVDESLLERTPPGFEIREVSDETQLYDFKKVFLETYQTPEWAAQAWVDATLSTGIGMAPWRIFTGYLEDEPVAIHILFNGAGVAGVYAVATIPAAQRQGIGAAITLKPLLEARERGTRYAVLFSTEAGLRVYQRIGFKLVKARINRYLWRSG